MKTFIIKSDFNIISSYDYRKIIERQAQEVSEKLPPMSSKSKTKTKVKNINYGGRK